MSRVLSVPAAMLQAIRSKIDLETQYVLEQSGFLLPASTSLNKGKEVYKAPHHTPKSFIQDKAAWLSSPGERGPDFRNNAAVDQAALPSAGKQLYSAPQKAFTASVKGEPKERKLYKAPNTSAQSLPSGRRA